MANKSGKGGTVLVNSVAVTVADWEFNGKADLPDATDSGTTAGYKSHVVGRKEATVTLRGYVDHTELQPTDLAAGTVLSTVHLTTDGTVKYVIGSATVESIRVGVKIGTGETVDWEATCKVNGSWTELA